MSGQEVSVGGADGGSAEVGAGSSAVGVFFGLERRGRRGGLDVAVGMLALGLGLAMGGSERRGCCFFRGGMSELMFGHAEAEAEAGGVRTLYARRMALSGAVYTLLVEGLDSGGVRVRGRGSWRSESGSERGGLGGDGC